MRVTVEITDAQRMKLVRLAAARGQRGFSRLVQEAIRLYLHVHRHARVKAALSVLGTLEDREATSLADATRALRQSYPAPRGSCDRS